MGGTGDGRVTRRRALAGLATGAAVASGGCVGRVRTIMGWPSGGQVGLEIKTVPTDDDPYAPRVARRLAEWFQAAGIDAETVLLADEELRRQVLLNHDFDVFVARLPARVTEPDELHLLLHSTGAARLGWQNPFGYTNLQADGLLEDQRTTSGRRRRRVVEDLQRTVAETAPFTIVGVADVVQATRDDRYAGWARVDLTAPPAPLQVDRVTPETDARTESTTLRAVTTEGSVTRNLNPLSVEFRDRTGLVDLLYDPLGRVVDGERLRPWLAADWEFTRTGDGLAATVTLRPDLRWHDGTRLTAADVAFTYEFLADTAAGTADEVVPAPRYQGEAELVRDVWAVDDRTVEFAFVDAVRPVTEQSFRVPVLPAHVWADRTDQAGFGGLDLDTGVTEALVTDNVPPVGSGPLAFVERVEDQSLVLERFEDHFLAGAADLPGSLDRGPPFDRLELQAVRSDSAAVELVADGAADWTATGVGADAVPRIGREPGLALHVRRPGSFYLAGFNARREPLSNPRFRSVCCHLVDEEHLVDTVFDGYATPAASLLAGTEWLPDDLTWDDGHPVTPFFGDDGELLASRAREAFREAGYRYEDDALVG